jgi:hypothetical protein
MSDKEERRLLMWGATQVGKTTLLAFGLLHQWSLRPSINWGLSADASRNEARGDVVAKLHRHYQGMARNRLGSPTLDRTDFTLVFDSGAHLKVRDIKGAQSRDPFEEEMLRHPAPRQGVLFMMEWAGDKIGEQMSAVHSGLMLCQSTRQKVGLIITKCELELDDQDPAWRCRPGWWRDQPWLQPYQGIVSLFGNQVWATSTYGYDEGGRPCCVLDEFGRVMPYNLQPRNVGAPFRWVFQELGLCSST